MSAGKLGFLYSSNVSCRHISQPAFSKSSLYGSARLQFTTRHDRSDRRSRNSLLICSTVDTAGSSSAVSTSGWHTLPDGMRLELLQQQPEKAPRKLHLVFLHGSGHAAWCWKDHFMPYFSNEGYRCTAISLRGQGESDSGDLKSGGTLASHAEDLAHFLSSDSGPTAVIAHSFGGLLLQKYLCMIECGSPPLCAAALLCSVPPSGNRQLVARIMKAAPMLGIRLTWGFITKSYTRSASACREMFFSEDIPQHDLKRYLSHLSRYSSAISLVDLRNINSELPIPPPGPQCPPVFVAGAAQDVVVDVAGVKETAEHYGVPPVIVEGMAHDCMLDTQWRQMANQLAGFLEEVENNS